jgi:transcriptional regulator with XRE-family HTH domain
MPDRVPGSPLRVARVRAGWRLHDLAKEVGLKSEISLWRIETGRTKNPTPEHRRRLAAVLKVKEAVLFGKM